MPVNITEQKIDSVIKVLFLKITKRIDEMYVSSLEILEYKSLYQNKDNYKPINDFVYNSFVIYKKNLVDTLNFLFKRPTWPTKAQFVLKFQDFWGTLEDPIFECLRNKHREIDLSVTLVEVFCDDYSNLLTFIDNHSRRFNLFDSAFDVDYYLSYWRNNTE